MENELVINKTSNYKAFFFIVNDTIYGNIEYFSVQYELVLNLSKGMTIFLG